MFRTKLLERKVRDRAEVKKILVPHAETAVFTLVEMLDLNERLVIDAVDFQKRLVVALPCPGQRYGARSTDKQREAEPFFQRGDVFTDGLLG